MKSSILGILVSIVVFAAAADPPIAAPANVGTCEDVLKATLVVDPKLDSRFFHVTKTSRPWHLAGEGSEDGVLEDTIDQSIDPDDLVLIEHTAQCTSSHQGEHAMEFCDAVAGKEGLAIKIFGGMPAYASSLCVLIRPDKTYQCRFEAVYPAGFPLLKWRITKKSLKFRSFPLRPGQRCYAWLSVEFEEVEITTGNSRSYKIEGELKPIVQSPERKNGP